MPSAQKLDRPFRPCAIRERTIFGSSLQNLELKPDETRLILQSLSEPLIANLRACDNVFV